MLSHRLKLAWRDSLLDIICKKQNLQEKFCLPVKLAALLAGDPKFAHAQIKSTQFDRITLNASFFSLKFS